MIWIFGGFTSETDNTCIEKIFCKTYALNDVYKILTLYCVFMLHLLAVLFLVFTVLLIQTYIIMLRYLEMYFLERFYHVIIIMLKFERTF